jgi:lactoylglutathione lyase
VIKKIEHLAIIVESIEQSVPFYTTMFGFKERTRGQVRSRLIAFLYLENQPDLEIELIQDISPQGPYDEKGIVNHLAFTVDKISEAVMYYKEKGIEFPSDEPSVSLGGSKTIFFYGPNRELLQLVERVKEEKHGSRS